MVHLQVIFTPLSPSLNKSLLLSTSGSQTPASWNPVQTFKSPLITLFPSTPFFNQSWNLVHPYFIFSPIFFTLYTPSSRFHFLLPGIAKYPSNWSACLLTSVHPMQPLHHDHSHLHTRSFWSCHFSVPKNLQGKPSTPQLQFFDQLWFTFPGIFPINLLYIFKIPVKLPIPLITLKSLHSASPMWNSFSIPQIPIHPSTPKLNTTFLYIYIYKHFH